MMSINRLPYGVSLTILQYMTRRENLGIVSGVSKRFKGLAYDPVMSRKISIFASKD